jgi:ribonuclease-3
MNIIGRILLAFHKRWGLDREYYRIVDELFGVYPRNIELYKLALLHRSATVVLSDGTHLNNERLEFLGDAIIEAVVSDYLFVEFPTAEEGELTRLRSKIVSRTTLNHLAWNIGLGEHIIQRHGGATSKKDVGGDAFEAMVGALYLDRGYDCVGQLLINEVFKRHLDLEELVSSETDYKSRLIEWCQKSRQKVHFDTKPDHNYTAQRPFFYSAVLIEEMEVGHGKGETKKEAEQNAAFAVWQALTDDVSDYILGSIDTLSNDDAR